MWLYVTMYFVLGAISFMLTLMPVAMIADDPRMSKGYMPLLHTLLLGASFFLWPLMWVGFGLIGLFFKIKEKNRD